MYACGGACECVWTCECVWVYLAAGHLYTHAYES